ncbi:MAG: TrkH family potassium uptake protein [Bacteroidales bacterium]|nr:TrkH family potassium uptake protein [Bacteroidales bacterium]
MNLKVISRNVGYALLVSALFMFFSIVVSLLNGRDSALASLLISFLITFIVGIFPFIFVRQTSVITLKEGYVIIVLSWLLSFVVGMLPYILWGGPFDVTNAWFESVSGYTTTGATILERVEDLPKSLLFWRSSTHFIGGLGVVVFLLLIIPNASPVKMRLMSMELSSLSKSAYAVRANRTVYVFALVYFALFVLSSASYALAGMPVFDAVCHAFSVSASGGFSTRTLSISAFDSFAVEAITMVFMLLSSIHFGLVFLVFATRSFKPLNNPVLKFYLAALLVFSLVSGLSLRVAGVYDNLGRALWTGAFHTISTASTTGFAISDNAAWPMVANMLLMMLAVMCGCAGSTSGGVKADRVLVLLKTVGRQTSRTLHPSIVSEVRLGGRSLKEEQLTPHLLYVAVYLLILAVSLLLAIGMGLDVQSAFTGSLSSLGNVGPAIGDIGSMGNYNDVPSSVKFIFTVDMFLGRIEIYPVFAVVAMMFGPKRR